MVPEHYITLLWASLSSAVKPDKSEPNRKLNRTVLGKVKERFTDATWRLVRRGNPRAVCSRRLY